MSCAVCMTLFSYTIDFTELYLKWMNMQERKIRNSILFQNLKNNDLNQKESYKRIFQTDLETFSVKKWESVGCIPSLSVSSYMEGIWKACYTKRLMIFGVKENMEVWIIK